MRVVIIEDLITKTWTEEKTERFQYDLKEKIKISKISDFSIFSYTLEIFWPRILTMVVAQDLKLPQKQNERKTKRLNYDLEQKRKFPRFPSFRFCPIPKIENSEIYESFVLFNYLKLYLMLLH